MLVRIKWMKYITKTERHFVGYLCSSVADECTFDWKLCFQFNSFNFLVESFCSSEAKYGQSVPTYVLVYLHLRYDALTDKKGRHGTMHSKTDSCPGVFRIEKGNPKSQIPTNVHIYYWDTASLSLYVIATCCNPYRFIEIAARIYRIYSLQMTL